MLGPRGSVVQDHIESARLARMRQHQREQQREDRTGDHQGAHTRIDLTRDLALDGLQIGPELLEVLTVLGRLHLLLIRLGHASTRRI